MARSGWLHEKPAKKGKLIGEERYKNETRPQLGFWYSFGVRPSDWSEQKKDGFGEMQPPS